MEVPSRGLSLDAHNVKRTLHLTIERGPDGSTSPFETLPSERLPCFSSALYHITVFFPSFKNTP